MEDNRFKIAKLYNGKIEVKFDNLLHRYYVNGVPAKGSVSGITGIVDKSGPLIGWAVKETVKKVEELLPLGEKIDKTLLAGILALAKGEHIRKKEDAADEGTVLHALLEGWINNGIKLNNGKFLVDKIAIERLETLLKDRPEALKMSIKQFSDWLIKSDAVFLSSERIVYSKRHKYPGMLDAEMIVNGNRVIGDFKIRAGVYGETRLQTAAYQHAITEETGIKYDERWIFRIGRKDGVFTGDFEPIKYRNFERDFSAFLAAKKLYDWVKGGDK